ncbi:hypothetical protein E2C01_029504 [Portunus trituberculatus]|uniref:Uncharacterized protein n=1 Tax=Portunus trituberculatus TaxID=210409 RepID=A0A5B7ES08_PORTR|nr:hypothetical protein [Portunus trituberculatus]
MAPRHIDMETDTLKGTGISKMQQFFVCQLNTEYNNNKTHLYITPQVGGDTWEQCQPSHARNSHPHPHTLTHTTIALTP